MDSSDRTRRGMKEALHSGQLGEEALAFVSGTSSRPLPAQPPVSTKESAAGPPDDAVAGDGPKASEDQDCSPWKPPPPLPGVIPGVVSLTFRLPASIAYRLASMSAERKLRRERPFSQQDIVADALLRWLDRHARRA